jgi:hypothetical protein
LNLFASHIDLIEAVANRHQAHWWCVMLYNIQ